MKRKTTSHPDPVYKYGFPAMLVTLAIISGIKVFPYVAHFIVGNLGI